MDILPVSRKDLQTLYASGNSMADIAKKMQCSQHKVAYWMRKYNLTRRSRSEAGYLKLNPNGDPFHIKQDLNSQEMFLYGLGLGIYWGEGEKVSSNAIRVANTDPRLLKTFIRFLLEICGLEKEKLLYSIICFNDINAEEAKMHWAKELKISPDKFGKIVQIPTQGRGNYKRKSRFGVCTVIVSNIKLKPWIMKQLADIV